MSALLDRAVAQAPSGAARSAARPSVVRADPGRRQRAPIRRSRTQLEQALAAAIESRRAPSTRRSRNRSSRRARLWALRENIAEAQRREGPNIKHDISVPVSAIPRFLDEAARRSPARCRACASSPSATWATATCTTTSPRREGVAPDAFLANAPRAPTGSSTTWSPRTAAASAPSTGSGNRSATSSSATRARSSSS